MRGVVHFTLHGAYLSGSLPCDADGELNDEAAVVEIRRELESADIQVTHVTIDGFEQEGSASQQRNEDMGDTYVSALLNGDIKR